MSWAHVTDVRNGNEFAPLWLVAVLLTAFLILSASASEVVMMGGHEANPSRLLAKLKPAAGKSSKAAPSADALARAADASPAVEEIRPMSEIPGLVVLEMDALPAAPARRGAANTPPDHTPEIKQRIEALMATGLYEYVEPDYVVSIDNTPNDSALANGSLWGLRNTGRPDADIDAETAWAVTTGSTNVVVAVIDTGIRYTHQDLAANMWRNPREIANNGIDDDRNGYVDDVFGINAITGSGDPMDDQGHGSHCAGTIGAQANGGGPHVGVAWNVRLMALKFLSSSGSGTFSDAIECINYAVANGAQILSNSWGGGPYSQALYDAILRSRNAGSLFVAAAGNESNNNDSYPAYPASYNIDNVISVAAMDSLDRLASFSNYGATRVHVGAPGVDIYSSTSSSNTSYASYNGTSMACPHVSGVAALALARFPGTTGTALRTRLLSNVRSVSSLSGRVSTGGAISASRVVGGGTTPPSPSLNASLSTRPSPLQVGSAGSMSITLTASGNLVTAATSVTGSVSGQSLTFRDNGISPDDSANDGIYTSSVSAFPTAGSYELSLSVSHPSYTPLNTSLPFEVIASSESNDNWSQSAPVSQSRLLASSVTATAETGEPGWRDGTAPRKTLWWRWRPASSGSFTITTFDSSFDTTLAIFTGNSLSGLTRITSNDDSGGSVQSSVTFNAVANTDYYIQVDGYGGSSGDIVLNIPNSGGPPPATPPVFSRNPVNVTVRPGATASFSAEASGSPTYQWVKDGVDLANNNSRISGVDGPTLTIINTEADDSGIYVCRATNGSGSTLSSQAILVVQVGTPPKNDDFVNRVRLQTGVEITASNEFASREPGELDHATGGGGASIWYRWVSTVNGTVSVNTSGSSFDTALAIYQGSAMGALTPVGSNNDNGSSPQSLVQFTAKIGQEYQIAVDGGRPGASGFVRMILRAGGSGGGGGEVVVPAPGMPIPVPDLGQIESEIVVSGRTSPAPLSSIFLDLNISHTFRGDLVVTLQAPSGEIITITNRQGGSASDLVVSSVPLNSAQFGGLSTSVNPNGTWRLSVLDAAGGDEGTLNSWALRFRDASGGDGGDPEVVVPGTQQPIPDLQTVTSTLTVSGQPSTRALNQIRLDLLISHTFVGDLVVSLQTPSGETINIRRREGGPLQEVRVQSQPLDTFIWDVPIPPNIDPNGTWILTISDEAAGDSGNLDAWALRFGNPSTGRPDLPNLPTGRFFGRFGELDPGDGGPSAREEVNRLNGLVTLNLTRRGQMTGRVLYRGVWQRLRGLLDASGLGAAVSVARDGTRLDFLLALSSTESGQPRLDGTVSLIDSSGQLQEVPVQLLPPIDLSSQPLRLNILMRNVGPDKAPVTGDGFAFARTARGGAFRYTGTSPDGVRFTGTGQILEVTPGSYEAIIAASLRGGNMLLGQPLINVSPQYGEAHLQGSVLWLQSEGVVNCLTQGVIWEVSRGQSLVENRPFVLMGLSPPWKSYFTTPVSWFGNNKAILDYDTPRPMRVAGNTGRFRGDLPLPPQSGSSKSGRYQGLLFGRPIMDEGVWLYGGGHMLEPTGTSSYVEIFAPDDTGGEGGVRSAGKIRNR